MAWNIEARGTAKQIRKTLKPQLDQADADTTDVPHQNRHTSITAIVVDAALATLENVAPDDEVTVAAGSSAGLVPPGTIRPEFTQINVVIRLASQVFANTDPVKVTDLVGKFSKSEPQPANVIDK